MHIENSVVQFDVKHSSYADIGAKEQVISEGTAQSLLRKTSETGKITAASHQTATSVQNASLETQVVKKVLGKLVSLREAQERQSVNKRNVDVETARQWAIFQETWIKQESWRQESERMDMDMALEIETDEGPRSVNVSLRLDRSFLDYRNYVGMAMDPLVINYASPSVELLPERFFFDIDRKTRSPGWERGAGFWRWIKTKTV